MLRLPRRPVSFLDAGDPAEVKVLAKSGSLVLGSKGVGVDQPPDVPRGKGEGSGFVGRKGERGEGGKRAPMAQLSPSGCSRWLRAVAADPEPSPGPEDGRREGNSFADEVTPEGVGCPAPFLGVSTLHSKVMRWAPERDPEGSNTPCRSPLTLGRLTGIGSSVLDEEAVT